MKSLWQDIRYGLRMLAKSPGFTIVIVLTLSLGIGASVAIFSVVDRVLVHPVVLKDADRLFTVGEVNAQQPRTCAVSGPVLRQLLGLTDFFEEVAAYETSQLALIRGDAPSLVWGYEVTPNFFSWFRARPLLGRTFVEGEGTLGRRDVVVLNHSFWRHEFGGDPNIIGTSIPLSNETFVPGEGQLIRSFTVIGVMPPEFQFPSANWGQPNPNGYWVPAEPGAERPPRPWDYAVRNRTALARLRGGADTAQVEAVLHALAARNAVDFPQTNKGWDFKLSPLSRLFSTADFRVTVAALAAAVGIILFLACANAANLLLVRAENRGREFVIRAAVGAGRRRLIRQLLTESVILGVLAGTAGLLLVFWVLRILSAHLPAELPRLREIGLDGRAFGSILLLSLATGILFGLMPAWRVARAGTSETLRSAGHGYTLGRERRLFQRGLIVAQIALTLVLLFSMGLMFQSVSRFLRVEPGYDPRNLLGFMVTHWNTDPPERDAKLDRLRDAFKALPGVTSVAVSATGLYREIEPGGNAAPIPIHHTLVRVRDSDYFRTCRIPLRRGRTFQSTDATGSVAIVSESLAKRLWPGEEAVGQWFQPTSRAERCEVVGVVGDVTDDPERGPELAYYEPYEKTGGRSQCSYFTLRTATDVSSLIPAVRKTLWQLDPMTIPPEMMLPQASFTALVQPRETFLRFLSASAAVSLALAVIGIYGVLAHLVACRTHEIGVRMALGATARSVLAMAMRQGAVLIVMGLSAGSLAAFLTARLIQSKLFGVSTTDMATLVGVALLLTAAALTACYVPARRASKVDPIVSLRYE